MAAPSDLIKGAFSKASWFYTYAKACCWLAQPDLPTSLDLILRLKSNSSQDDDEGHKSASGLHNILNLIDLLNSEKGFTHCRPTVDFSTLAPEKWRNFPRIIMAFSLLAFKANVTFITWGIKSNDKLIYWDNPYTHTTVLSLCNFLVIFSPFWSRNLSIYQGGNCSIKYYLTCLLKLDFYIRMRSRNWLDCSLKKVIKMSFKRQ